MQKFKTKTTMFILVTALLLTALFAVPATASAAEADCLIAMSGGVNDDNSVFIDVVVMANSGISALKLRLDYDKTVFDYVDGYDMDGALDRLVFTKSGKETDVDDIRFLYGPGNYDNSTGLLMRIELRVKDGAKPNVYKVGLVCEQALNNASGVDKDVSVSVRAAKVKLSANGSVDVTTDSAPVDVTVIVAVLVAVVLVAVLVVVVCVRTSRKRNAAKSRAGWKKI